MSGSNSQQPHHCSPAALSELNDDVAAAMCYTIVHLSTHAEDVNFNRRDRGTMAELNAPRKFEVRGHRHVESSFFRKCAEKADPELYTHHLHKNVLIFPSPWKYVSE